LVSDTIKEDPLLNKRSHFSEDSAQKLSQHILSTNPFFNTYWIIDEAFVFEDIFYDEVADSINLNLVDDDQSFKLTWYGKINSTYKKRWGRYHQGIDIDLKTGDYVYAAFDGIVRYAQFNNSGFGNCVIIRHFNGLETVYGHLSKITVASNQFVKAGNVIGLGGSTGRSTGPHLHFETRYKDFSFDPLLIIDPVSQNLFNKTFTLKKEYLYPYKYGKSTKLSANQDLDKSQANSSVSVVFKESNTAIFAETDEIKNKEIVTNVSLKQDTTNEIQKFNTDDNKVNTKTESILIQKDNKNIKSRKSNSSKVSSGKKVQLTKKAVNTNKTYTVKKGDNLYDISRKTGVSIDKIKRLNKLKASNKIMPGDKLKL
jgi:murein DD-endopeptidase MepM/ murein hydrolase activator NlpD